MASSLNYVNSLPLLSTFSNSMVAVTEPAHDLTLSTAASSTESAVSCAIRAEETAEKLSDFVMGILAEAIKTLGIKKKVVAKNTTLEMAEANSVFGIIKISENEFRDPNLITFALYHEAAHIKDKSTEREALYTLGIAAVCFVGTAIATKKLLNSGVFGKVTNNMGDDISSCCGLAAGVVGGLVGDRLISHNLEHRANLIACRALERAGNLPAINSFLIYLIASFDYKGGADGHASSKKEYEVMAHFLKICGYAVHIFSRSATVHSLICKDAKILSDYWLHRRTRKVSTRAEDTQKVFGERYAKAVAWAARR